MRFRRSVPALKSSEMNVSIRNGDNRKEKPFRNNLHTRSPMTLLRVKCLAINQDRIFYFKNMLVIMSIDDFRVGLDHREAPKHSFHLA